MITTNDAEVISDINKTVQQKSYTHPNHFIENKNFMGFKESGFSRMRRPDAPFLDGNFTGPYKITQALISDKRILERAHPTIQQIMKRRNPAQYGDAVSMYEHKNRERSNVM